MARVEQHTEETHTHEVRAKNPGITSGIKVILGIVIGLILLGIIGYFGFFRKSNNNDDVASTADEIRNAFQPSTSSNPSFGLPNQGGVLNSPVAGTSTPPVSSVPPTNPPPVETTPRPVQPRNPAPATPFTYTNPALGFQVTLPASWAPTAREEGNRVLFFDRSTGAQAGYVEIYEAAGNGLDEIALTLEGSPDVTNISQASISGLPAIKYQTNRSAGANLATVHNGRIYYFHNGLASSQAISGLRFI